MNPSFLVNVPYTQTYDQCFMETVANSYLDWFRYATYKERLFLEDEDEDFIQAIEFIEAAINQIPDKERFFSGAYNYSYILPMRHSVLIVFIKEVITDDENPT